MIKARQIIEAIIKPDPKLVQEIMEDVDFMLEKYRGEVKTLFQATDIFERILRSYSIHLEPFYGKDTIIAQAANVKMKDGTLGIMVYCGEKLPHVFTDPAEAQTFREHFRAILEHELVHMEQNIRYMLKRRQWPLPSQYAGNNLTQDEMVRRYLSDPHELMAYAKSILRELLNYNYTKEDILTHLRAGTLLDIKDVSGLLTDYAYYFSRSDPAIKKFLSYLYQYTQDLD